MKTGGRSLSRYVLYNVSFDWDSVHFILFLMTSGARDITRRLPSAGCPRVTRVVTRSGEHARFLLDPAKFSIFSEGQGHDESGFLPSFLTSNARVARV